MKVQLLSSELRWLADYVDSVTTHPQISLSEHHVYVGMEAVPAHIALMDDGTWCAEFGGEE